MSFANSRRSTPKTKYWPACSKSTETQGKSTEQDNLKLQKIIVDALEDGEIPVVVWIELGKAFECVSHDRLLEKLKAMEIQGQAIQLIRSYLSDRKQMLRIASNM